MNFGRKQILVLATRMKDERRKNEKNLSLGVALVAELH